MAAPRKSALAQRVTQQNLGAWVVKCNPSISNLPELIAGGVRSWCVREGYRSRLVEAGQPVLLWVTGATGARPYAGIWAAGQTTGPVEYSDHGKLVMPLTMEFLPTPVPREEVAARLPALEVVRQPFMSNPSFATTTEYAELCGLMDF
jgi:hypothetical protein